MPGSPKWSLSFRFPHHVPVYASPVPHTCYMPHPSHSSRFYHPNKCPPPSVSWASSIQSIPLHPTSWRSVLTHWGWVFFPLYLS
jgi:hypothetical protein